MAGKRTGVLIGKKKQDFDAKCHRGRKKSSNGLGFLTKKGGGRIRWCHSLGVV